MAANLASLGMRQLSFSERRRVLSMRNAAGYWIIYGCLLVAYVAAGLRVAKFLAAAGGNGGSLAGSGHRLNRWKAECTEQREGCRRASGFAPAARQNCTALVFDPQRDAFLAARHARP
jgi:hypothetical protein